MQTNATKKPSPVKSEKKGEENTGKPKKPASEKTSDAKKS